MAYMADKPRSLKRRLLFGLMFLLLLAGGGYFGALKVFRADPAKLTTWGSDLDKALEQAKKDDKLVLVKAGSEY
jgi:hypothetical protein